MLFTSAEMTGADDVPQDPTGPTSAIQTASAEGPLLFSNTAVGGTFDRLHAGHRILLAATALVTTTMAFIGVTSILTVPSCVSTVCDLGSLVYSIKTQSQVMYQAAMNTEFVSSSCCDSAFLDSYLLCNVLTCRCSVCR